jgi:GNAT superfamily N-acetyltransferase
MLVRGLTKKDYDYLVSVIDRWWGGPSAIPMHPIFYYELGHHALVAEAGDEVVGFLFGFITDVAPRTGYVHMVGIHPDQRRHGVGKRLYESFFANARAAGATRIKTIAVMGDEGPVAFHRALGFEVGEDANYAGPNRARLVFVKSL